MKRIAKYSSLLGLAILAIGLTGCTRIEPGYVGIKVNQAGSNKGVEDYPLQTGWVTYFPLTTRVYEYPTFQQNVIWCASPHEGKAQDESISFNCKGGAAITADVSMSGKFVASKVPHIFVKFRSDPEVIVHGYLRNEVRDALGRIGATYDPMEIIGDKRGEFLDKIKAEVKERVGEWWEVDYITFANKLKVDEKIESAINAIIAQKQQTMASELKVKQTVAEAEQTVAKAEGEQRSKVAVATGEAQAILLKAKAQADANTLIAESLAKNPLVLQSIALDKWNGIMPYVVGSGPLPFIQLTGMPPFSTNNASIR
jgi:regulator of protease activity HflC (stomatin/prohibitin superfamily)